MNDLPKGDYSLVGIAWPDSKTCDLELKLRGSDKQTETIRFTWVKDLSIDLNLSSFIGLTWDIQYRQKDKRVDVCLDFSSDGQIKFECEEIIRN